MPNFPSKDPRPRLALLIFLLSVYPLAPRSAESAGSATGHPRLYVSAGELTELRNRKLEGVSKTIRNNLVESAEWCLTQTPREGWIAPADDDPIYENLYDRFYAMMKDMAIAEHLAFAYALTGEECYGEAAREWTLASCRSWKNDADAEPDGGKAYAVSRLLKGVAVSYDLAFDRFSEEERREVRGMLVSTARNYFERYFTTPSISGPGFHTHHATVEFSSFGVVALALLGEVKEAEEWLEFTIEKFTDHLLPTGLAEDGAQVEGATYWASTMHYRLFFMDALRRVTGRDLFQEFASEMNADLALASITRRKEKGWNQAQETVLFSPSYGQLDYYAPVLLALAREYKNPHFQYLALWDESLGSIQKTRYVTPNRREQLLFELGGYAALWYDQSLPAEPNAKAHLSYAFPSVGEVYARASWAPGGMLVAVKDGGAAGVHVGGEVVLMSPAFGPVDSGTVTILADDEDEARLHYHGGEGKTLSVTLKRPDRVILEWTGLTEDLSFWSHTTPREEEGRLQWKNQVEARVIEGALVKIDPAGLKPGLAVGNGRLDLVDPMPTEYPLITLRPGEEGRLRVEIRVD